jgi:hypothetical protein
LPFCYGEIHQDVLNQLGDHFTQSFQDHVTQPISMQCLPPSSQILAHTAPAGMVVGKRGNA